MHTQVLYTCRLHSYYIDKGSKYMGKKKLLSIISYKRNSLFDQVDSTSDNIH